MITTPGMGLTAWNSSTDIYSSDQLAVNWAKIDQHNHAPGKGIPIPTDGIQDGAITADKFAVDAFGGLDIPDNSVTTPKIVDLAVTTAKLNDLGVTTGKINNLAVTSAKIANNTITSGNIAPDAIGTSEIATNAVDTAEINAGAVGSAELASAAVTSAKVAPNAITSGSISAGAVVAGKLGASSVIPSNLSLASPNDTLTTTINPLGASYATLATVTGLTASHNYLVWVTVAARQNTISTASPDAIVIRLNLVYNGTDHETPAFTPVGDSVLSIIVPAVLTSGTTIVLKAKNSGAGDASILGADVALGMNATRMTLLQYT